LATIDKLSYTRVRELFAEAGLKAFADIMFDVCHKVRQFPHFVPNAVTFAQMASNGCCQPAKGAKAANAEHRHTLQAVWAVLGERNFIKTGMTLATIAGSGKMANPLGHTKRHVRNLVIALDSVKEVVLNKALKAAIGLLTAPVSMTTWLDDIMRSSKGLGACECRKVCLNTATWPVSCRGAPQATLYGARCAGAGDIQHLHGGGRAPFPRPDLGAAKRRRAVVCPRRFARARGHRVHCERHARERAVLRLRGGPGAGL
jgi:hypothetical protein